MGCKKKSSLDSKEILELLDFIVDSARSAFVNSHALDQIEKFKEAINDYHNKPVWDKIVSNGMSQEYSWENSAKHYYDLYKRAIDKRRN